VCQDKEEGGLGIKNLSLQSSVIIRQMKMENYISKKKIICCMESGMEPEIKFRGSNFKL
jgi:hypothetical protein